MSLSFYHLLSRRAIELPQRTAFHYLTERDHSSSLTYKQLLTEVLPITAFLQNIASKQPVILLFSPGLDFVKALLGCLSSGNIAVPVAIPKPAQEDNLLHILQSSGATYVLSDELLISKYKQLSPTITWLNIHEINKKTNISSPFTPSSDDTAILQFTSGSTGKPKGVMVTYQNLVHNICAIRDHFNITEASISFSWLPHYHDMGLIDGILQPVVSGCVGLLTSPKQVIGRPDFWLDCISRYRVTHTGGPNFFFELCLRKTDGNPEWDLSSLHDLYISAEPVRITTLKQFAQKFTPHGFSMDRFTPGFGLAEATLMVSCKKSGSQVTTKTIRLPSYTMEAVDLGPPVPGMEIRIVDPKTLLPCDQGNVGEIWLRGPSVTQGYWSDEVLTLATYHAKIPGSDVTFLRTGDLGILENDSLFVVGRLKDTIIHNGLSFHAEEIEYAIVKSHTELKPDSCVVFSHETGTAEKIVVLLKISPIHLKANLSEFEEAVYRTLFYHFGLSKALVRFHSASYPKTTSGKIRRSQCRRLFLANKFAQKHTYPS